MGVVVQEDQVSSTQARPKRFLKSTRHPLRAGSNRIEQWKELVMTEKKENDNNVESWEALINKLKDNIDKSNSWLFRGQNGGKDLKPKLERLVENDRDKVPYIQSRSATDATSRGVL